MKFFRDNTHKNLFQKALKQNPNANAGMMSAIYLLTADKCLWSKARSAVGVSGIAFDQVKLRNISTDGYTLFFAAKDLYCGTKYISLVDIADTKIVPPKLFDNLCNAMAIRRYGIKVIETAEKEGVM